MERNHLHGMRINWSAGRGETVRRNVRLNGLESRHYPTFTGLLNPNIAIPAREDKRR